MANTVTQDPWKFRDLRTVPKKAAIAQRRLVVVSPLRKLLRLSLTLNLEDVQDLWAARE